MRRLYGTGDFEHVNYRILEEPGKRVLAVDAVEKAWGPNYLRAGIGLSSDFSGDGAIQRDRQPPHDLVELARCGAAHRLAARLQQRAADRVLPAARCPRALLHRAARGDRRKTRSTSTAGTSASPSTTSRHAVPDSTSASSSTSTASCGSASLGGTVDPQAQHRVAGAAQRREVRARRHQRPAAHGPARQCELSARGLGHRTDGVQLDDRPRCR